MTKDYAAQWPELKYENWKDTCQTLQRWVQIVGKIRLTKSPWTNHSWGSTLYVTAQGLTTSVIHDEDVSFTVDFDFVSHFLRIQRSDGRSAALSLVSESVSDFYQRCMDAMRDLGIRIAISDRPNELSDAAPFSADLVHCTYDPEYANRFLNVLLQADRVMKIFRSRYVGKVSPVHFFWGSFDLAVSRFSGRPAPEHAGGIPHLPDRVTREAYSHELSSCGFWPGNDRFPFPAFYSYAYPRPKGFELAEVRPSSAYYDEGFREFVLPYEMIRTSPTPDEDLLAFFQSSYEAAAKLGNWDRQAVESSPYLKILQGGTPELEKRSKSG